MAGGKQAARDARHGRRGGGWIDEPRPDAKAAPDPKLVEHTCPVCGVSFLGVKAAVHCGTIVCTAMSEWDAERWAGAARMARSRAACGIAPGPLDAEALRRTAG